MLPFGTVKIKAALAAISAGQRHQLVTVLFLASFIERPDHGEVTVGTTLDRVLLLTAVASKGSHRSVKPAHKGGEKRSPVNQSGSEGRPAPSELPRLAIPRPQTSFRTRRAERSGNRVTVRCFAAIGSPKLAPLPEAAKDSGLSVLLSADILLESSPQGFDFEQARHECYLVKAHFQEPQSEFL